MGNLFSPSLNDIPLDNDGGSRPVCWVVGLLVFLLSMIYMGALMVSSPPQWRFGGSGRITVEVPLEGIQNPQNLVEGVLTRLQHISGVNQINVLDNQEILTILQPWVGQVDVLENLTLPCLIDVDFKSGAVIDHEGIAGHLQQLSPQITLEKHSQWQEKLQALRSSLEVIACLFMVLIGITVMITITLVTRSSLAMHTPVIDALRLMGATNLYIARKFQRRAFRLALKGGLWGAGIALPAFYMVNSLGLYMGGGKSAGSVITFAVVAGIVTIPFIVGGLSLMGARVSVMKTLRQMG